jgi:hypothetical protein
LSGGSDRGSDRGAVVSAGGVGGEVYFGGFLEPGVAEPLPLEGLPPPSLIQAILLAESKEERRSEATEVAKRARKA